MYSRNLGKGKRLIKRLYFPWRTQEVYVQNIVYLGIGGNVGDTLRLFDKLFWVLRRERRVCIIETSPILKNPPFGFLEQSDFYNGVIAISTSLEAKKLLRMLLSIERRFGRKRSFKDAPRTLDIDMIFYNNLTMHSTFLTLPHPHWHTRASVLIPLSLMKLQ